MAENLDWGQELCDICRRSSELQQFAAEVSSITYDGSNCFQLAVQMALHVNMASAIDEGYLWISVEWEILQFLVT
jgi:hypothetical protein